MTEYVFLQLIRDTMYISLILALPILIVGTIVGIIISIIQTATSIQDQSLAFIPKLIATIATIIVLGPWMLTQMVQFTIRLLGSLQNFSR